jgi:hypothetical protein
MFQRAACCEGVASQDPSPPTYLYSGLYSSVYPDCFSFWYDVSIADLHILTVMPRFLSRAQVCIAFPPPPPLLLLALNLPCRLRLRPLPFRIRLFSDLLLLLLVLLHHVLWGTPLSDSLCFLPVADHDHLCPVTDSTMILACQKVQRKVEKKHFDTDITG